MSADPYLIGYARVSKGDEQSNAAQRSSLEAAGCKRIFEETASGGRWDRPKLLEMIGQLRDGDVVVVWKLDRLSRSLKDMLHIMERIEKKEGTPVDEQLLIFRDEMLKPSQTVGHYDMDNESELFLCTPEEIRKLESA